MKQYAIFGLVLVVIALGTYIVLKEPRLDRVWAPELEKTAEARILPDETVILKNVRDWTYGTREILSDNWIPEVALDPSTITRAWFVLEPFAKLEAIGHTYLTFEFADGSAYSFSVEARKEADETYSAWKGLWNEYELAYTWGTERDFLTRRLLYLEHPVRMYPLAIDQDAARRLFVALTQKTGEVSAKPRFYHTLTANCTNILAEIANSSAIGSVPYDISWNLPGLSDDFLMRIGYIVERGTAEETKAAYDLTPYRNDIKAFADADAMIFSKYLRTLIEK